MDPKIRSALRRVNDTVSDAQLAEVETLLEANIALLAAIAASPAPRTIEGAIQRKCMEYYLVKLARRTDTKNEALASVANPLR